MRNILLLSLFFFLSAFTQTFAQKNDVTFLIETIKDAYAGYSSKAGNNSDLAIEEWPAHEFNKSDTFLILSAITDHFRDQHLKLFANRDIINDTIGFKKNFKKVTTYLNNSKVKKTSFEGYWINDYNNCLIAIVRTHVKPWDYFGYVIESRNQTLPVGLLDVKFKTQNHHTLFTDFITSVSGKRVCFTSKIRNDSLFTIGPFGKWRKLKTYRGQLLPSLPEYSDLATATRLDKDNFLIRIPVNSEENTTIIDSVVKANAEVISKTKNLIIDIRNNGGGTVRTYNPLLQYIYTKPIKRIGVVAKCSSLLLKSGEEALKNDLNQQPPDTALITQDREYIRDIKKNFGGNLTFPGGETTFDSTKIYPKNVALIVNYGCMSAAEMMVLDFKQSSKVTIFGEHTFGAVDYLDVETVDLPSNKYKLFVASSKRILYPGQKPLDNIGISPDVPINDSVTDWVKFVVDYYKTR